MLAATEAECVWVKETTERKKNVHYELRWWQNSSHAHRVKREREKTPHRWIGDQSKILTGNVKINVEFILCVIIYILCRYLPFCCLAWNMCVDAAFGCLFYSTFSIMFLCYFQRSEYICEHFDNSIFPSARISCAHVPLKWNTFENRAEVRVRKTSLDINYSVKVLAEISCKRERRTPHPADSQHLRQQKWNKYKNKLSFASYRSP